MVVDEEVGGFLITLWLMRTDESEPDSSIHVVCTPFFIYFSQANPFFDICTSARIAGLHRSIEVTNPLRTHADKGCWMQN